MGCEVLGSSATRQQHVVAVPLPAQGHLTPLMRFCQALASHGVLVTFVNIDPVHHRLLQLRQPRHVDHEAPALIAQHGDHSVRCAHIPICDPDILADNFRLTSAKPDALLRIAPQLELLILHLNQQGPAVTCIVSDLFITNPTQNLADKLNLPRIAFYPGSASSLLLLYYVMEGVRTSTTKVLEALTRRAERMVVCEAELPGLPALYNDELPSFNNVVGDDLYMWGLVIKFLEESCRHARGMVINSSEDLEAAAFTALSNQSTLPLYGVGPLVKPVQKENSTSLWKEDEACILWLDQQPAGSVLYISFGSIALLSQRQLEEIVAGLLSSQQGFLWAFRPDLVENVESSRALVADVLISKAHGKGYVVDWAPQLQVLAHPSVGGFLTHCGWNSTMEAITHGVPMLCWPYFGDQHLNAKYVVEEWKVGLRCEATRNDEGGDGRWVERGEVERVVRALMKGEEGGAMRKNAMALKEAASQRCVQKAEATPHNNSVMQALITSLIK